MNTKALSRRFVGVYASRLVYSAILLGWLLAFEDPVRAQSPTAALSGTVRDASGAVVPGVDVTLRNAGTGATRQVATDGEGVFAVPQLSPGRYTVNAQHPGFATLEVQGLTLGINEYRSLQLTLSVGALSESVTIDAESLVESESGSLGTRIEGAVARSLPYNGRSFQFLIELTPGAVLTTSQPGNEGQFSVNGQRTSANYFMIDGVGADVGIQGGPRGSRIAPGEEIGNTTAGTSPPFSVLGGTNSLVSVDAVEEVNIQSSTYAPEFGRTPGGQVSIVTRSGTNEFHGALFEYFRNDALDANNWFANRAGFPKPPLRHNDFGVVVGGPILRDRTFFFVSYEGLRLRQARFFESDVPSLEARASAPKELRTLLDAFPIPNQPAVAFGFAGFAASYSDPSTLDSFGVRVDHRLNDTVSVFGRYSRAPSESTTRVGGATLNTLSHVRRRFESVTIGSIQLFGARFSNDLRVNWSRSRSEGVSTIDDFGGAVVPSEDELFPGFTSREDTEVNFDLQDESEAYTPFLSAGLGATNLQRQFNILDQASVILGPHQMRFGFDYRRISPHVERPRYILQAVFDLTRPPDVSSLTLGGLSTNYTALQSPSFHNLSLYWQDTWRALPALILTYGVRWELNPPPSDDVSGGGLLAVGTGDPRTLRLAMPGERRWNTSYTNFAPRIGVAYALNDARGRETVLRGGWGMFYDLGTGTAQPLRVPGAGQDLTGVPYPFEPGVLAPAPLELKPPYGSIFPPFRVPAFHPRLRLPLTYQFNLTIEQALGVDQTISASYVGALGRRLLTSEVLLNPNPTFGVVRFTRNGASSDYHALQVQFQRRMAHGIAAHAAYTWSHAIDIDSSDVRALPARTIVKPQLSRASASFDVRHVLAAAVTLEIPEPRAGGAVGAILRDWSLDTTFRARSAFPVDVFIQSTFGGVVFGTVRPNVVRGKPFYLDDPAALGGWRINRAAFASPPPGKLGALGRNALRGFPVTQLDVGLGRGVRLTDKVSMRIRGEVFNVLNHPNFADPSGIVNFPDFGVSTQTLAQGLGGLSPVFQVGGARSVQLVLRLEF